MKKLIVPTHGTMAMKLDAKAKAINPETSHIYNLAAGDPNIPIPTALQDGLMKAARDGVHQYCSAQGLYELRCVIDDPDKVLISNGAKQLIYMALMCTCEPGDTVLMIGPCWSSYKEICKILKLNVVQYIPFPDEVWSNDPFEIEKYFSKYKPNVVLFTNPSNPTGIVEGQHFIEGLLSLCEEHDCWLLSDEIYDNFVYDASFSTCLGKSSRVIYINGFSKAFAATGWRIGYCVADPLLIAAMTMVQSQISGPPNTVMQQAILNAMDFAYYTPIDAKIMKERRNEIASYSPLLKRYMPYGGFYFYIPVANSMKTCEEFAERDILLTPGDDYGVENTIRLSFANITLKEIKEIKPYLELLS